MKKEFFILLTSVCLSISCLAAKALDAGFCPNNPWDNMTSASISPAENSQLGIFYTLGKKVGQITIKGENKTSNLILLNENTILYTKNLNVSTGQIGEGVEFLMGHLKLVSVLLNKAYPAGPSSIKEKSNFNFQSNTEEIDFTIDPGTRGSFGAPWNLKGYVLPIGPNKFQYNIVFNFHGALDHKSKSQTLSGELAYEKNSHFNLPDSFDLTDYTIASRNLSSVALAHIKTLGQLKKQLKTTKN